MLRTATHKLRVIDGTPEVYEVEKDPTEKRAMRAGRKQRDKLQAELQLLLDGVMSSKRQVGPAVGD